MRHFASKMLVRYFVRVLICTLDNSVIGHSGLSRAFNVHISRPVLHTIERENVLSRHTTVELSFALRGRRNAFYGIHAGNKRRPFVLISFSAFIVR